MSNGKEYLIKYQTFDQLLDSVKDDLETYDGEGFIDSSKLIKVVRTINKKLGLKLHKEKEQIIEVSNFRAKLPDDFFLLNFAMLCFDYEVVEPVLGGTHTEDFWVQLGCNVDECDDGSFKVTVEDNACERSKLMVNARGDYYTVMQKFRTEVRQYTRFDMAKLKATSSRMCNDGCFNMRSSSANEITIQDSYLYTNFEEGKIYINYIGDLIDEEGNLLVLDHPLVTDYYEYALKRRILENMYIDSSEDVVQKLNLIEQRFIEARRMANKLVNTPEFTELQEIWLRNRGNYYKRFYYPIVGKV